MKTLLKRTLKDITGRPRRTLLVAAVAAVSLTATTTVTTAAWVDNEWAGGGVGVASLGDCSTNTLFSGVASARQLSGTVLGSNLNSIAGIEGLIVTNSNGTASPLPVTASKVRDVPDAFINKLPVTALDFTPVTAALGLGLPVGDLGAYTQWSQAQDSGQVRAAAGLVTDQSGAVQVGSSATEGRGGPSAARIMLGEILPESLAGVTLDVGAVASSASVQGCEMANGWPTLAADPLDERDYGLASLSLTAKLPAVGDVAESLDSAFSELNGLEGALQNSLSSAVSGVVGSLGLASSRSDVDYDVEGVYKLLTKPLTEGAVTVDLSSGEAWVDLSRLTSASLNGRASNTSIQLSDVSRIRQDMEKIRARVTDGLRATLNQVPVTGTITTEIRGVLGGILLGTTTYQVSGTIAAPEVVIVKGSGLNLSGLLAGVSAAVQDTLAGVRNGAALDTVLEAQSTLEPLMEKVEKGLQSVLTAVGALVSIHVNVQPDQLWTGVKPDDVSANPGEYKVSAIRVGLINQPGLLSLSLGTSAAGPVNYRPS